MSILGTNETVTLPGTIVCFDTETSTIPDKLRLGVEIHSLRLGVAISGRIENGQWTREKRLRFRRGEEFWDWLDSVRHARMPVWAFAHNLSFDLTAAGFWSHLESRDWSICNRNFNGNFRHSGERKPVGLPKMRRGLLLTDDPPTVLIAHHHTGWSCRFIDTLNYFPMSLHKLGAIVGRAKLPMPRDDDTLDTWYEYCTNDVEIIRDSMLRLVLWHHREELGRWSFTVAGTALAAFRHRFMSHHIDLPEQQEQRDFEREGCYQGRVQPFWIGSIDRGRYRTLTSRAGDTTLIDPPPRGPFHLLDSSSFYGAVAAFEELPQRMVAHDIDGTGLTIGPSDLNETYLADVLIAHPTESFPVRRAGGVTWAVGCFWTTLCGPELVRAIKCAAIARVGRWSRYELAPIFQRYALGIWSARRAAERDGDRLIAVTCKQLLARLHGKFQQRNGPWCLVPEREAPTAWARWSELHTESGTAEYYRAIGWDVECRRRPEDAPHCFPALAGWVMSHGREWLLGWIRACGSRQCLYCSTDSLIVTHAGLRELDRRGLISTDTLGGLRVVESSDSVEIRGPNNYTIGNRTVIAGRNSGYKMISKNAYETLQVQTLRETLERCGPDTIEFRRLIKTLPPVNPMGLVGAGGWVTPVCLALNDETEDQCRIKNMMVGQ